MVEAAVSIVDSRRYYYNNGNEYDGKWLNKMRNGEGKFTWKTGEIYEGNYVNDKRHTTEPGQKGTMTY